MDGRDKPGHDNGGVTVHPVHPHTGIFARNGAEGARENPHILNTPNLGSGMGALSAADSATTRRVFLFFVILGLVLRIQRTTGAGAR